MQNTNRIALYKRSEDDRFFAQLERKHGEPIAVTDQTYADLGDLLETVFAFKREAETAPVNDRTDGGPAQVADYEFEVVAAPGDCEDADCDGFTWRFQGPNHRTLFVSTPERFRDRNDAREAVAASKRLADACVADETGEPVDVEYFAGTGQPAPLGASYKIRVDRDKVVIGEPTPTGREILRAANRVPVSQWQLYQRLRGGQTKAVGLEENVDLTCVGVERFQTVELTVTDGASHRFIGNTTKEEAQAYG